METTDELPANDPLSELSSEAAAIEAGADAAASPGAAMPPAPVDPAQEWRDAAAMAGGLVVAMYPELKSEWTQGLYDNLGNALAKCAEHYGWKLAEVLTHPILGLALAAWPLGTSLGRVMKARAEEKARKKREAAPQSGVVQFAANTPRAPGGTVEVRGVASAPGFAGVS